MAGSERHVRACVVEFLEAVGGAEELVKDEDVVQYLVGFVEDSGSAGELAECIQAFVEPFEELEEADRLRLAQTLRDTVAAGPATTPSSVEADTNQERKAGTEQESKASVAQDSKASASAGVAPPHHSHRVATDEGDVWKRAATWCAEALDDSEATSLREDLQEFLRSQPSADDLADYLAVLSPVFAAMSKRKKRSVANELLRRCAGAAVDRVEKGATGTGSRRSGGRARGRGRGRGRGNDVGRGLGGARRSIGVGRGRGIVTSARDPVVKGHAAAAAPVVTGDSAGGKKRRRARRSGRDRRAGGGTLPQRVRRVLVSHVGGADDDIVAYVAAFLEDAGEDGDAAGLQAMLEPMVAGFDALAPAEATSCVTELQQATRRWREDTAAEEARKQRNKGVVSFRRDVLSAVGRGVRRASAVTAAAVAPGAEDLVGELEAEVQLPTITVTPDDPRVALLHEVAPTFARDLLPGIVQRFQGDMAAAGEFLLSDGAEEKEKARLEALRLRLEQERQARIQQRKADVVARRSVLKRYDEEVDTKDKTYRPVVRMDTRDRKARTKALREEVRFFNNKRVYMRKGKLVTADG